MEFDNLVMDFLEKATSHKVEMIMVGGGAVNFHGYQRHSADVDFWINVTPSNLQALKKALQDMEFDFDDFPEKSQGKRTEYIH